MRSPNLIKLSSNFKKKKKKSGVLFKKRFVKNSGCNINIYQFLFAVVPQRNSKENAHLSLSENQV